MMADSETHTGFSFDDDTPPERSHDRPGYINQWIRTEPLTLEAGNYEVSVKASKPWSSGGDTLDVRLETTDRTTQTGSAGWVLDWQANGTQSADLEAGRYHLRIDHRLGHVKVRGRRVWHQDPVTPAAAKQKAAPVQTGAFP